MDLLLFFPPQGDSTLGALGSDMALRGGDLVLGDGLLEAVWLSLFTDARAPDTLAESRLDDPRDRRGWWGDGVRAARPEFAGADGRVRPLGSLLWTLSREKQTEETRLRAQRYAYQALAWMPPSSEPAAAAVAAVAARSWWPRRGLLALETPITLRSGAVRRFLFERGLARGEARYLGAA